MKIHFNLNSNFDAFFRQAALCWENAIRTSSDSEYLNTIIFLGTSIELGILLLANSVAPDAIYKKNGHTITIDDACKILRNDAAIFSIIDKMFFPSVKAINDKTCLSEIKRLRNALLHNYGEFETEIVDAHISDALLVLNYMMTLVGKIPISEYERKIWLIDKVTEGRENYRISPVLAERMNNILHLDKDNYFDFPDLSLIGNICENCGCEETVSIISDEINHLIVQCIICLKASDLKICLYCDTAFHDWNGNSRKLCADDFICEICLENLLSD
jgi:hypothetical protein